MFLEKPQCQLRQTPLFGMIDRSRRPNGVGTLRGPHFDEDDTTSVHGDYIDLAQLITIIPAHDAIPQPADKALCRPLRARAKPAPPPRLPRTLLAACSFALYVHASSTSIRTVVPLSAPSGSTSTTRTGCPARRRRLTGRVPPWRSTSARLIRARGVTRSSTNSHSATSSQARRRVCELAGSVLGSRTVTDVRVPSAASLSPSRLES